MGFKKTPMVFPTITGTSDFWHITGVNSIYNLSAKGFRIYIKNSISTGCGSPGLDISTSWARTFSITLNYMVIEY